MGPIRPVCPSLLARKMDVGRAPQQVEDFLAEYVKPMLEKNKDLLGVEVEITV